MKRKGGVPPIVTVLVTIAAVVAASLVAWFLWTTTRSATQQPVLEATNAYVTCAGSSSCTVSFTVRNTGAAQISSISLAEIVCETTSGPRSVTPSPPSSCPLSGQAATCTATFSAAISDGASCTARLTVSTGSGSSSTLSVGFKVIRP